MAIGTFTVTIIYSVLSSNQLPFFHFSVIWFSFVTFDFSNLTFVQVCYSLMITVDVYDLYPALWQTALIPNLI